MSYSYDENIYYSPEKYGLSIVGTIDLSEPDYSFDMLVVWKSEQGQFWVGTDSGCSCPSPFEEINDVNELDGPYERGGLKSRLGFIIEGASQDRYSSVPLATLKKEVTDLLRKV